jgi:hypothetical protein
MVPHAPRLAGGLARRSDAEQKVSVDPQQTPAASITPYMTTPGVSPQVQAASPLSPEHIHALHYAQAGSRKIRRAVGVARFDGWSIAVFAALTFLFGIGSAWGIIMGLGMGAIAAVELHSANRLQQLDPRALRRLSINQLVLAAVLIIYALWQIGAEYTGHGTYAQLVSSDPQLASLDAPIESLTRLATLAAYGGVIAIAIFGQGGLALYYHMRRKHLTAYLAQTPPWIIEMQRANVQL